MPLLPVPVRPIFALWIALCTPLLQAQTEEGAESGPRYSAELGIGVEYDSNIAVEEVDRSSNESDYALTLNAGLGVEYDFSDTAEVGLTYDFNQSSYSDFSQVDRQTHILGTSLNLDLSRFDTGVSFFYINSRLDGQAFLELYRVSPSVSGFLAKKWFARGAYVYADKTIENRPGRDANTNAGEADLYFFHRGLRSYLNLGYRLREEDANADRYDYRSHSLKLRYIYRFELLSDLAKLELAWRYEDRDYHSITPGISEKRSDQRHRWRIDFELPILTKGSAVQFYYGYSDFDSNLPQADYSQTLTGMRFVHRW